MAVWSKEQIQTWLKGIDSTNPKHRQAVLKALLFLYSRQTADEQTSQYTKHQNGMGFNGTDAQFLTDVAQRSAKYRDLTPKQAVAVARSISKYAGQLVELANPIEAPIEAPLSINQAVSALEVL